MHDMLRFSFPVQEALAGDGPVVALESTVITHGLPYPQNVETALMMEAAVRAGGATPATIAILSGRLTVGLTTDEIEYLGQRAGQSVRKCSRRDLAIAVACGEDGATTVAGTMLVAHMAGIELFATGGIGGVHRGHPFDVSADLRELGRTPVTVVSSGAKSILDLPATREVLETEGVSVVGYGTDELPAFFAQTCGLPVDVRLDDPAGVAALIRARRRLGLNSGTLVTVPAPAEACMDPEEAEAAAARAAREADELGIHGAASTPWLLRRVVELTEGRSLRANTALLQNNGRVAAEIAVALAKAL
ncbi:pseudouridine-5'-phosphate glycosidase [Promineifilum sp.]|uniref:pseudouridine-5'-phosphate glycosidase n=1 Tax=Promineifilum sp. TaxID=2664178 RepID=UPI0035B27914